MFQKIVGYFKEIIQLWIFGVSLILDLLGFLVATSIIQINIPVWIIWSIAVFLFLVANIQLYIKLKDKIDEYEKREAEIILSLLDTRVYVIAPFLADRDEVENIRTADGLSDVGWPICTDIVAVFEIENIGYEEGELICEVDLKKSELPEIFTLFQKQIDGSFYDRSSNQSVIIPGRDRQIIRWYISLSLYKIKDDTEKLAEKLNTLDRYKFVLNYYTKRIGGESKPRSITIGEEFDDYVNYIIKCWKERDLTELMDLVDSSLIGESRLK